MSDIICTVLPQPGVGDVCQVEIRGLDVQQACAFGMGWGLHLQPGETFIDTYDGPTVLLRWGTTSTQNSGIALRARVAFVLDQTAVCYFEDQNWAVAIPTPTPGYIAHQPQQA